jgi:hypothetical protein
LTHTRFWLRHWQFGASLGHWDYVIIFAAGLARLLLQ